MPHQSSAMEWTASACSACRRDFKAQVGRALWCDQLDMGYYGRKREDAAHATSVKAIAALHQGGNGMILRIWHGVTPAEKADAYSGYLQQTGLPGYRSTPGNLGVQFVRRVEGDRAEFLAISWWESYEAIRGFAGDDITRAVYYPEDDDFLLEREPTVAHYEVFVDQRGM